MTDNVAQFACAHRGPGGTVCDRQRRHAGNHLGRGPATGKMMTWTNDPLDAVAPIPWDAEATTEAEAAAVYAERHPGGTWEVHTSAADDLRAATAPDGPAWEVPVYASDLYVGNAGGTDPAWENAADAAWVVACARQAGKTSNLEGIDGTEWAEQLDDQPAPRDLSGGPWAHLYAALTVATITGTACAPAVVVAVWRWALG